MPITIAVANQEGGCGKTSVSMNIAGALAREGEYRVLLIDADPEAGTPDAQQTYSRKMAGT